MSTEELGPRVREARRKLSREGPPWTRDRERDFELVAVAERSGDQLRDLLIREGAETVVEVGLAYAGSALAIGEALVTVAAPRPRHVVIDPMQERAFSDVGWNALCSAGLDSIAELVSAPSSIALPQLLSDGLVADAAFVDGSHRFHEVFVDLYFLRKIVRPGGVVVIDDDWWPSVHTAARYYERNLGWKTIPDAFDSEPTAATGADSPHEPAIRCKAFRLPDALSEPPFQDFHAFWPGSGTA
jgi:predicted O-methyltransferase YrrM